MTIKFGGVTATSEQLDAFRSDLGVTVIATLSDGTRGLIDAVTSKEYSLAAITGVPVAPVSYTTFTVDAGSDIDHPQLLCTWQATTGTPDSPSDALASARFSSSNDPLNNVEVWSANIDGALAGGYAPTWEARTTDNLTVVYWALHGSTSYTVATGATLTAGEMIRQTWEDSFAIRVAIAYIGPPYAGAGSNNRYRQVTVVGYAAE